MSAFQRGGVANAQHRTKSRFHSDFWPCICTGCHCVYVPSTKHHSCFGAWQNYPPIKFNYITIYIICSLWCSDKKGCVLIWIYPFNFSPYLLGLFTRIIQELHNSEKVYKEVLELHQCVDPGPLSYLIKIRSSLSHHRILHH